MTKKLDNPLFEKSVPIIDCFGGDGATRKEQIAMKLLDAGLDKLENQPGIDNILYIQHSSC